MSSARRSRLRIEGQLRVNSNNLDIMTSESDKCRISEVYTSCRGNVARTIVDWYKEKAKIDPVVSS